MVFTQVRTKEAARYELEIERQTPFIQAFRKARNVSLNDQS